MASTNIRVDSRTHATIRDVSQRQHKSIGQVVADAIEQYQEDIFWQEMEDALTRLKANPVAWQDYQDEIAFWDTTSGDGLEQEELDNEDEDVSTE